MDYEDINANYHEAPEARFKFHSKLLERIGNDFERNKTILKNLTQLANEKKSILFFAPSVDNANIMSALLNDREVTSAEITGQTSWGVRQTYIRKFKDQKIKVLCNYGVLTTGFDAPLIDAIMIARPTESPNLYEQMIGRGLRGPEFGGTEECLILDLLDNIRLHKVSRKEELFRDGSLDFWESMKVEDVSDELALTNEDK